jgi:quinol monooxygenase YgiN
VSNEPVLVFATFRPTAETEEALVSTLETMIEHTRAEPGNEVYDLYASDGEGARVLHLFERYRDQEALEAHRASDHYVAYRAKLPDLLASPVEVTVLSVIDAQG